MGSLNLSEQELLPTKDCVNLRIIHPNQKKSLISLPGILAALALLFLFLTLGLMPSNTHALSTSQSTDLQLNISPVIALTLTNCPTAPDPDETSLTLNVQPVPSGTFRSNCQVVSVDTNAPGYTLLAKASGSHPQISSGSLTNALIYQNPTSLVSPNFPKIPATASAISSPAVLTPNYWGFAVDQSGTNVSLASQPTANFDGSYTVNNAGNKFAQLPTTDTIMYKTLNFPGQMDTFKFFYGVNLNAQTIAGTYQTTVTYTAVAEEPAPLPIYSKVVNGAYFQDKTTNINQTCAALPTYPAAGSTIVMTDNRNGQQYRVRKLQDNKCWMIDNLKLELTESMVLTPSDTNVLSNTTINFDWTTFTAGSGTNDGNFVIAGYMSVNGTSTGGTNGTNRNAWRQANPGNEEGCLNNAGRPSYDNDVAYNPSSLTGCGYHYNWYTVTAGTGLGSLSSGDASSSICPIGWRLPSAGTGTADTNNEFAVLNSTMQTGSGSSIESDYYANWLPDGPFQGTYAGSYYSFYSPAPQHGGAGLSGHYWSSSVLSASHARTTIFETVWGQSSLWPGTYDNAKLQGASARCLTI